MEVVMQRVSMAGELTGSLLTLLTIYFRVGQELSIRDPKMAMCWFFLRKKKNSTLEDYDLAGPSFCILPATPFPESVNRCQ
jgi:hypothetical protein